MEGELIKGTVCDVIISNNILNQLSLDDHNTFQDEEKMKTLIFWAFDAVNQMYIFLSPTKDDCICDSLIIRKENIVSIKVKMKEDCKVSIWWNKLVDQLEMQNREAKFNKVTHLLKIANIPFVIDTEKQSIIIEQGKAIISSPYELDDIMMMREEDQRLYDRLTKIVQEETSSSSSSQENISDQQKLKGNNNNNNKSKKKNSKSKKKANNNNNNNASKLNKLELVEKIAGENGGYIYISCVHLGKYSQYAPQTGFKRQIPNQEQLQELGCELKYFQQRYRLFSHFDKGIRMDAESWFSVTPEAIAEHIAERCRSGIIVDAFAGAGGNTIQFAFTCERVIAIEFDYNRLEIAKHNAKVYGVEDRIEFILGDAIQILKAIKNNPKSRGLIDTIFLSPPWGGPEYQKADTFDIDFIKVPTGGLGEENQQMVEQISGTELFQLAYSITPNVAYFLPRNTNPAQCLDLLLQVLPKTSEKEEDNNCENVKIEFEQHIVEKRIKTCTFYCGNLFAKKTFRKT